MIAEAVAAALQQQGQQGKLAPLNPDQSVPPEMVLMPLETPTQVRSAE